MTCGHLGGSVGSWLGVRVYGLAGGPAVCALVALLAALALASHLAAPLRRRGSDRAPGAAAPIVARSTDERTAPLAGGRR
ncbi:MFS transporter, partial [Kitasatospora sp. NPDC058263]